MFKMITHSEKVFGMSKNKRDVAADLESTTREIVRHLAKLYLYPTSEYINHWKQEIYGFLHTVCKLKNTKKFPSQRFILDNTINENLDLIKIWYEDVYEDYTLVNNMCPERFDTDEFYSLVLCYYDWMSDLLSTRGSITQFKIYTKLDELFMI